MCSNICAIVTVMFLALSVGMVAAVQAQGQIPKEELQRFQCTWVLIAAEMDGKKVDEADVKKSRMTLVGDKIEVTTPHQHKDKIVASLTKLDLTKNPKEIQWVRTAGPKAGTTLTAIYEFEGPDRFKICFDPSGLIIPKEFGTKAGSGHILHIWRRVNW